MSVNVGDRNESKVEFDNTYFKIHDDAVFITVLTNVLGQYMTQDEIEKVTNSATN